MGTAVAQTQKTGIATYLGNDKIKENVMSVVGERDYAGFVTSIVSAVQTNKDLAQCTNGSILNAALLGQSLKLSPSPQMGEYYMVKYENKGVAEATFQLGYKGLIMLAMRSNQYRKMNAIEVREGELIECDPFNEEYVFKAIKDPERRKKAKVIGYYAYFELTTGFRKELYWTKEEMTAHAKQYSKGFKNDLSKGTAYTFWSKNFDEMAKKTMLRQLISKWGIMSIDMQTALTTDSTIEAPDGSREFVQTDQYVPEQEPTLIEDQGQPEPMPEPAPAAEPVPLQVADPGIEPEYEQGGLTWD